MSQREETQTQWGVGKPWEDAGRFICVKESLALVVDL